MTHVIIELGIGLSAGILIGYILWHQRRSQEHLPKEGEIEFMYIVKDNNPNVGYSLAVGEVKDAEGNVIPNPQLIVEVVSDNPGVVAVTPAADGKSGSVSFGAPGQATLTANVKDAGGNILATGAASFTVTTGDPASVASVNLAFDGLTEL